MFANHLTEGLRSVLGDYPQIQLKPELQQVDSEGDETLCDFVDNRLVEPLEGTSLGELTRRAHMKIVDMITEEKGTYEDLYDTFSQSVQDWIPSGGRS